METSTTDGDNFSFWRNLILTAFFFLVTPLVIGTSLFSLYSLFEIKEAEKIKLQIPRAGFKVYAALPNNSPAVSGEIGAADARTEVIRQYLEAYSSPLAPYASLIVQKADEYNLDFRLTTAIAQQESNLCRHYPEGTYNCWGWGIHSAGTLGFPSFEEGIEAVSKGLREEYLDKGFVTINETMSKYTPLSNGSWADGVETFMGEME